MSLDIPNSREDERLDAEHEAQKDKHLKDHVGDEIREAKDAEYRAKEKATWSEKEKIGFDEKADRRHEDMTDASIKETVDTELRGE